MTYQIWDRIGSGFRWNFIISIEIDRIKSIILFRKIESSPIKEIGQCKINNICNKNHQYQHMYIV